MDIGQFLRAERHARDLTQVRLAALTGVGQSRISEIEHGLRSPSWGILERLLEGMGRQVVLDTRPIEEDTGPQPAGGTLEERYRWRLPLAAPMTERLSRYGARVCLDGPTAALLLGLDVRSPWLHFASPREDVAQLLRAMNDGAALGWSERFRDYRIRIEDEDQLDTPEPTRWDMRGAEISIRLCEGWRPVTVAVGDLQVEVMSLDELGYAVS
ncbi:MAG: hypothetical protein QOH99_536 [Frankiaceae bacterium]|nr:hypothetical protein [Frankiaceae bacterium]